MDTATAHDGVRLVGPDGVTYTDQEEQQPERAAQESEQQQQAVSDEAAPPHQPLQGLLHHRVREVAWHIPWYGFKTQARLAHDSGISPSTVSRLLRGQELPSLLVALRLTDALSHRLGRALDVGQVFSLDGLYSRSVCDLTGCRSCLPPTAYDRDDNFLAPAPGAPSGQWVKPLSRKGAR